jgi:hypothetical protein
MWCCIAFQQLQFGRFGTLIFLMRELVRLDVVGVPPAGWLALGDLTSAGVAVGLGGFGAMAAGTSTAGGGERRGAAGSMVTLLVLLVRAGSLLRLRLDLIAVHYLLPNL